MATPVNRNAFAPVDLERQRLVDWLWPTRCLLCGERGHARRDLCAACATCLPRNHSACRRCAMPLSAHACGGDAMPVCGECLRHPSPLAEVHAAFLYAFPIDRLLPRFKFHGDLAAGRLLSQLATDAFAFLPRPQALVALPLHGARLGQRGYDQALELARPMARALRIPLRSDALVRIRATEPQSRLDARQRHRNLHRAFAAAAGVAPLPAHVALVDDVMTTGATLHAAALALRRAGVERVDAWVCARVA